MFIGVANGNKRNYLYFPLYLTFTAASENVQLFT